VTRVLVHRAVVETELPRLREVDAAAAEGVVEAIRGLVSTRRGGQRLARDGWRAYLSTAGYAVIACGVGSDTVRVLSVAALPALYDRDRLQEMAEAAGITRADTEPSPRRDPVVPRAAPRSRIVVLDDADTATPQRPTQNR
jgi:hypothetical protein